MPVPLHCSSERHPTIFHLPSTSCCHPGGARGSSWSSTKSSSWRSLDTASDTFLGKSSNDPPPPTFHPRTLSILGESVDNGQKRCALTSSSMVCLDTRRSLDTPTSSTHAGPARVSRVVEDPEGGVREPCRSRIVVKVELRKQVGPVVRHDLLDASCHTGFSPLRWGP